MKWQPIETAPKGDLILLIDGMAIQAEYDPKDKSVYPISLSSHGCGCCSSSDDPPTHWMPLPEPPAEKESA